MKFFNHIFGKAQLRKRLIFPAVFILSVFVLSNRASANNDCGTETPKIEKEAVVIESEGFKLTNITALAEAYTTNNQVLLADFTGIDYEAAHFEDLVNAALDLKTETGFDVWDIGFNYVALQAADGLQSGYQGAANLINSDKYVLFCFILQNENAEGELADFIVEIGGDNHGLDEEKRLFLQEYVGTKAEEYFHEKKDVFQRFFADAYALKWLLSYFNPNKVYEPYAISSGGEDLPFLPLKQERMFISYSGAPILLPSSAKVAFLSKNHSKGGVLHQFKLKDKGGAYISYMYATGSNTGKFAGYGTENEPGKIELYSYEGMIPFRKENPPPPYVQDQVVKATFGFRDSKCGSGGGEEFFMRTRLYSVKWPDESCPNSIDGYSNCRSVGAFRTGTEINNNIIHETGAWDPVSQQYVGRKLYSETDLKSRVPCSLNAYTKIKIEDLFRESHIVEEPGRYIAGGIAWSEDEIGMFRIYNGNLFCIYSSNSGDDFWVYQYDENYGWEISPISNETYINELELVAKYLLKEAATYIGGATFFALNIAAGNALGGVAAVYGAEFVGVLLADIAVAELESVVMYYVTGDDKSEKEIFVTALTGLVIGNKLGEVVDAFRTLKSSKNLNIPKIKGKMKVKDPETGEVTEVDLDEYWNTVADIMGERGKDVTPLTTNFFDDIKGNYDLNSFFVKDFRRIKAWKLSRSNGDELNKPFLEKLSNDLNNPLSPLHAPESLTSAQVQAALNNPKIYTFYKKFATTNALGVEMRQRYLEAITLSNAIDRIVVLDDVLKYKKDLIDISEGLDDVLKEKFDRLGQKNIAFGNAVYKINGVTQPPVEFISIAGSEPSNTLINDLGYSVFQGKIMIPKVAGAINKRFFHIDINNYPNYSFHAQDSEVKIIEYILSKIAQEKGIIIPQGADKAGFLNQVLNGADLKIIMKSEMKACDSCHGVLNSFNQSNSHKVGFQYGTEYYQSN